MAQRIPAAAFEDGMVEQSEISEPILIAFDDQGDLHDKNTMTADPIDSDFVYAVWDLLDLPTGATINPDPGVFGGGLGFKGAALFSRTTDGGETWSEPTVLYNPGGVNQTIGNQIVVDHRGVLFSFFNEILNLRNDDGGAQFEFNLSLKLERPGGDLAATWPAHPCAEGPVPGHPESLPATTIPAPVRTADVLFDVAVDPDDGTVGVSYYDFRKSTPGNGTGTDHWLVHCDGACNRVGSWGGEEVRIGTTFDIQLAPFANGYFLGDYVGLDNIGDNFTPFFTRTMPDPADVYYATVSQ